MYNPGKLSETNSPVGATSSSTLARGEEHSDIASTDEPDEEFAPDIGEASRFIGALIREDQPGEYHTFQTFDDSEEKEGRLAKVYHGGGNAKALANANAEGAGIFLTISATDGRGRQERNIKRPRAVFVDADKDGAAVLAAIDAAGLAPHIIVESSPGKFHVYWLVDRDFPAEKFSAVQTALAQKFGTDPAVKDLARVMRLPGFYHMKNREKPFMVRILELRTP
jgi:hypothetical protein